MATARVQIDGIKEFRKALKSLGDKELMKGLRLAYKEASTLVANRARGAAPGSSGSAIRPRATQRSAAIAVAARPPRARGVFFGAKARFGWYRAGRYRGSNARQFESWVGNQWEPGSASGKPYFIGDAINDSVDEVIDTFGDAVEKLAAKAFPN